MRIDGVAAALHSRLRHPGRGAVLLVLGLVWAAVRLLLDLPYGRFGVGEAFVPLALLVGSYSLAPMAWQWTGDERPLAPSVRGLVQSLLLNSGWLLAVGWLFLAPTGRTRIPGPPPPREGVGPSPIGLPPTGERAPVPPPPRRGFPLESGQAPPDAHRPPPRTSQRPLPPASPEVFLFSLGLILSTVLGRSLAEGDHAQAREAALLETANQAKALALQSQMQPHALFNALSGLVELVHEDPQATEDALVALCDYLRRLMAHSRATGGPLSGERELLEDYLRLEQIRLGDRLQVHWNWPTWANPLRLPPLLVQPMVENAIVHGISPAQEGGELRITLLREDGALRVEIANTGRLPDGEREGTGMGHLKERLALWHPAATFALTHDGGWTRARLHLPEPLPPC